MPGDHENRIKQTLLLVKAARIEIARQRRNRWERPDTLHAQPAIGEQVHPSAELAFIDLERLGTETRNEISRILHQEKAAALKQSSHLEQGLRYGMHSRHKAWEQLTSQNHQSAQPNITSTTSSSTRRSLFCPRKTSTWSAPPSHPGTTLPKSTLNGTRRIPTMASTI